MPVDTILAGQAGVISRAQALAAGLSRDAVDQRVRSRRWSPLHPSVYLAAGHHRGDEAAVRSAVLWAGPDAALSGLAAAWWWGLVPACPPVVTVTVGLLRRPHPRPGITVRRRELDTADRTVHRGIAVTAPALTVVEAAVELGDAGAVLLDRTLRDRVGFAEVFAAHGRHRGAPGSASAGRLLVAAADRSAAGTARELVALLRRWDAARGGGVRGDAARWSTAFPVGVRTVAVAFPDARVAIETDVRPDRRRQQMLDDAGWTVVHCTWADVVGRPHVLLDRIAVAVTQGMLQPGDVPPPP